MLLPVRKTVLWVAIASASVSAAAGCSDSPASPGGDGGTGQGGHGGAPSGHTSSSAETETGGQGAGGQGAGGQMMPPDPSALAFSSGSAEHDAAYTKAIDAISADIEAGKFLAGESWPQVWTRDTSYSIDLGAGLLQPAVSKATLEGMTEDVPGIGSVWVQDVAGHFGGWPHLTDSIVGAQGAYALYLTTDDRSLLEWSYRVTANTLTRAERDVYYPDAGLFGGCSTFMESNSGYPSQYQNNGALLSQTKALSTNLLYYRAYVLAARMGQILGEDVGMFQTRAAALKDAINARLWMNDLGYYAYFEDENGAKHTRMEATGEAFAILWGVADEAKTQQILANLPVTAWGVPSLWPQFPEWMNYNTGDANYYHNGMIWPFVQGYWAWAAAKGRSLLRFEFELNRLLALSEKTDTFHEFYRPEDGTPDGSRRQLWSASGYLAMIYHGLFGMNFDTNGVEFTPVVPAQFSHLTLSGVRYRGMTLDVSVIGSGTEVATFELDGSVRDDKVVPADLTGTHSVEIKMATTATNLALNKPVTGSAPCAATESPARAVDGSVFNNSKWCSGASSKWLLVDLEAIHDVTRFVLVHAGAVGEDMRYNTEDFDIMVSTDNVSWTQAVSVRGNKANTTAHAIVARAARYVRLDVITPSQSSDGAARIYELEVY